MAEKRPWTYAGAAMLGTGVEGTVFALNGSAYREETEKFFEPADYRTMVVPNSMFVRPMSDAKPSTNQPQARAEFLSTNAVLPVDNEAHENIRAEGSDTIVIGDARIKFGLADVLRDTIHLPSSTEMVVEATGAKPLYKASGYVDLQRRLVRQDGGDLVILAAHPIEPDDNEVNVKYVAVGVNEEDYEPEEGDIISNASCTTKALVTGTQSITRGYGRPRYVIAQVIHGVTGSQPTVDKAKVKGAKGRSSVDNMVGTSTGASKAAKYLDPETPYHTGVLPCHRVPVKHASSVTVSVFYPPGSSHITEEGVVEAMRDYSEQYPHVMQVIDKTSFVPKDVYDTRRLRRLASVGLAHSVQVIHAQDFTCVLGEFPYSHDVGSGSQTNNAANHVMDRRSRA